MSLGKAVLSLVTLDFSLNKDILKTNKKKALNGKLNDEINAEKKEKK